MVSGKLLLFSSDVYLHRLPTLEQLPVFNKPSHC